MASVLEKKFNLMWLELDGPPLEEELRFHKERKWRFDFAHPQTQTAIEIEGGQCGKSRHTNLAGYLKDCEKYNTATAMGWSVFRIPSYWLTFPELTKIRDYINARTTRKTLPESAKE